MKTSKPKRRTRAHDREAKQREALELLDSWQTLRSRFPEAIQALGDSAFERMTLRDLIAIEVAELAMLDEQLKASRSIKARERIVNAKTQSRKSLRALVIATGPALTANVLPILLPAGMDDLDMGALLRPYRA